MMVKWSTCCRDSIDDHHHHLVFKQSLSTTEAITSIGQDRPSMLPETTEATTTTSTTTTSTDRGQKIDDDQNDSKGSPSLAKGARSRPVHDDCG